MYLSTGFLNFAIQLIIYIQEKSIMRQEENISQTIQIQKTEYAAVENSKESQQVPRLFHFLKLNRDRVDLQTQKQLMFDSKNLTQIVRQLGKQLNKQQVQYNKIYVGNLCNFILIVKRPRYSNFLSLLNSTFYSNLTSIFKDVVLYWKDNEHNDKSQVARAKIIAFLKILTQMHMNKKNYPRKVFGQGTLHVLRMIDPSKDEKVLRFFLKIIFQCQIFINNKLKVDFAQIMYKCLKFKHFPLAQFNKTIRFVRAELSCHYLQSYEFKNQIVKNCKNILIQNLLKEDSVIDLKSLAIFINSITANQKEYEMTLTQFSLVCNVAKNKTLQQNKISCLMEMVKNIKIDTNQQKLHLLMAFTGEDHIIKNSLIKLLPEVIKKLSSGCLIEIVDSQLLQKIIYIIKDNKYPRAERFSAVQVYKILCVRMKEINHIIYEHMIQILAYLKEVFHESHDKEIEQAFHMDQVQMELLLRFTLN